MDEAEERALDPSPEWQRLIDLMIEASKKPTRERFRAVGEAALEWSAARRASARESTSSSVAGSLVYKDNPLYAKAVDHLGRELVAKADGGYVVEATEDTQRADEGLVHDD